MARSDSQACTVDFVADHSAAMADYLLSTSSLSLAPAHVAEPAKRLYRQVDDCYRISAPIAQRGFWTRLWASFINLL